ncbi:SGNH/GDSL hydrolase family protein [Amycolatopsis albispora]|uniref:GDSL family lipase n=1 Tax=Amycolatopsis albispora TaxID=1804986 RepID=A0A344LDA6_9PSEU|nr:SGNH/GDSL hydrolase family protein [Amycolatopsis albispora]AXB46030.1 GDSL family lipase [Amycolatopsis albispora]
MHKGALVAAALLTGITAGTGVASASPGYEHYVALGDSYTSGPLIPFMRLDPLGCARSTNNYPSYLARNLDVDRFTDVSCGGADTTHMTAAQSVPLGSNPPQFTALKAGTDLVTIGIGGNDFGVFGTLISECPPLREQDPTGTPCRDKFTVNGVDTIKQRIEQTGTRVTAVLDGVHERSPDAKVLLVGYPRIGPPTGTCPDILPFADGDLRWLDSVEQALNDALAKAAAEDGDTTFVDMYPASLGHDACAPGGAAWIQGKDINLFAAANYHPRRAGMAGVATEVQAVLTGKAPAKLKAPVYNGPVASPDQVAGVHGH